MRKLFNLSHVLLVTALMATGFLLTSCNNTSRTETGKSDTTTTPGKDMTNPEELRFTASMVDNQKDPSCGMPVTAGIHDTAHYQQKVIGFCSAECKAEFQKDPAKYIAAAQLK